MTRSSVQQSSLDFLQTLKKNNNREWFTENKQRYTQELEKMISFADQLLIYMKKHDEIETNSGKSCLYRIYKDTRFSKDKTPYKTNWSGGFRRNTAAKRGGYYFHLAPGNSYMAGGFFNPNPKDLFRIRQDIQLNYEDWNLFLKESHPTFGDLQGASLLTTPKGFEKDHPAIQLLRHKQFILKHSFTDEEVLHPDFALHLSSIFSKLRPFFDYMSEVLTTDLNGISLI
jgi:uncharacterized protein (TIGR02453 family)